MTDQPKCQYCLEPMNEGARYCRGCGRKRPSKITRIVVGTGVGLLLLGALYIRWDDARINRGNAFIALQNCEVEAGVLNPNSKDELIAQIAYQQKMGGLSWRDAYRAIAVAHGCRPETGSRFLD